MSFVEKYAPQIFEAVRGQGTACAALAEFARRGDGPPVLLSGPWGCGKTSLARIFARAINCTALTPLGSPCLKCEPCRAFGTPEEFWFFTEVACATQGASLDVGYFEGLSRIGTMVPVHRRVIFFDEAHAIPRAKMDVLLNAFETPGIAAFVLATTAPEAISGPLTSRCQRIPLKLLSVPELISHGQFICTSEGIVAEPHALRILATSVRGHVRDFVMELERLSLDGTLTTDGVAAGVDVTWAHAALHCLLALTGRDVAGAETALRDWGALPDVKARALRDALVHVSKVAFTPARANHDAHIAFLLASPALIHSVASAVSNSVSGLGVPPLAAALALAEQWARVAPHMHDDGDLEMELLRAAHGFSPNDLLLPPVSTKPVSEPVRAIVRRTTTRPTAKGEASALPRSAYLTKADVRGEYRAATLLPQLTGLWFNARLLLRWRAYGLETWAQVRRYFSDLTHELALRLRDWTGDPDFRLHFLVQHEVNEDGGFESRLVLHVTAEERVRALDWLSHFLPTPPDALYNALGADVWRAPNVVPGRGASLHWSLMRELWRPVNPALMDVDETGRRRPLRELLDIPPTGPRAAGILGAGVRRFSTSHTLGSRVWADADNARLGFVSALDLRAWRALSSGWELTEHRYRADELKRRAAQAAEVVAQFPPGRDAATDLTRDRKLQALTNNAPHDPTKRWRPSALW